MSGSASVTRKMKSWSLWNWVGYRLGVANKFAGANTAPLPIAVFQMDELENGSKKRSRQFTEAEGASSSIWSFVNSVAEAEAREVPVERTSARNFAVEAMVQLYR